MSRNMASYYYYYLCCIINFLKTVQNGSLTKNVNAINNENEKVLSICNFVGFPFNIKLPMFDARSRRMF